MVYRGINMQPSRRTLNRKRRLRVSRPGCSFFIHSHLKVDRCPSQKVKSRSLNCEAADVLDLQLTTTYLTLSNYHNN